MPQDEYRRFSDEWLKEFHDEFKGHELENIKSSKQLLESQKELSLTVERLVEQAEKMQEIIYKNNFSIQDISNNTADLVNAWNDMHGAVRIGSALGKFLKWASGLAFVGWIFIEISSHINK